MEPDTALFTGLPDKQLFAGILAYGLFRQRPENQYLLYNGDLEPEKATHLF